MAKNVADKADDGLEELNAKVRQSELQARYLEAQLRIMEARVKLAELRKRRKESDEG
jgi:hypothetical protein